MSIRLITKPISSVSRPSLASELADKLREKIIRGQLHEGEQLRQEAIAAEFQVSKIPLREAFRQLEAEGLIKLVANHGAIVSALSPAEIEQMFEIRAVLECHALRQAINNFTEEDFLEGEQILAKYTDEYDVVVPETVALWGNWNWEFHEIFYKRANRPVLMSMLKTLNTNCDRYTRTVLLLTGNIHDSARTHRMLLDAFRTRDAEAACKALWQHLTDASRLLKEYSSRHP